MREFDIIIFDLDDTLFDFQKTEHDALKQLFQTHSIPFNETELNAYRSINVSLWTKLEQGKITRDEVLHTRFYEFFKRHDLEIDGRVVEDQYRKLLNEGFDLLPEAIEVLQQLKQRGYRLIAATNGNELTQLNRLEKTLLDVYFDDIFISEVLGYEKPHPQFFEAIFKKYKEVDKSKLLMIGDNLNADIFGAHQSGLQSIWMNHLNRQSTDKFYSYEIKHLTELLNLLK